MLLVALKALLACKRDLVSYNLSNSIQMIILERRQFGGHN